MEEEEMFASPNQASQIKPQEFVVAVHRGHWPRHFLYLVHPNRQLVALRGMHQLPYTFTRSSRLGCASTRLSLPSSSN